MSGLGNCLFQVGGQFSVLAIGFVVQHVQVVLVFFQRQKNSYGLALGVNYVMRAAFAQGVD